jgi:hypothetical protein
VLKWIVTLNPYYAVIIILGCPLTVLYSGIYKNGVIFHKAYDRIKNYGGRVYLSRNNLDKYISNEYVNNFIKKYHKLSFLENNMSCVSLVNKLLYDHNIFNRDNFFVFISNFNDKHLYKVNFMNIENIKIKNDYIKNIQ